MGFVPGGLLTMKYHMPIQTHTHMDNTHPHKTPTHRAVELLVRPIRCDAGNFTLDDECCVDVGDDSFLGTYTNVTSVMPGGSRCAAMGCGVKVVWGLVGFVVVMCVLVMFD